jgi:transcriptional regulator PpsR
MTRVKFAQPDITLTLDTDGVIQSASLANPFEDEATIAWLGRPWVETASGLGGDRIRRMVEDARSSGFSAFRQVTQRLPSGREVSVEYTTVRLGGEAGFLAIGRNLQAVVELQTRLLATQQAREQDYWKLRDIETRSRLFFDQANEAVLLVQPETLQVIEANPAAIHAIGIATGDKLLDQVAPADRAAFEALLLRAREQGRTPGILCRLGAAAQSWTVRATLMNEAAQPVILLQLVPVGGSSLRPAGSLAGAIETLLERLPQGFAELDAAGALRHANRALLTLLQMPDERAVLGKPLQRWLSRPGADAGVLLGMLQRHDTVRFFPTTLIGEFGAETEVEISAATGAAGNGQAIGLLVHDVSRRLPAQETQKELLQALARLNTEIGRTPMPVLVRGIADLVETRCIETALELSHGKRSLAAELLGLSRQSLYAKLHRLAIGEEPETPVDATT